MKKIFFSLSLCFVLILLVFSCVDSGSTNTSAGNYSMEVGEDYPVYGGNKAGNRFSPLDQITKENVSSLEVSWMYNAAEGSEIDESGRGAKEIQCQPIVVDGVLYGTSPELELFALNASTGKEIWKFKPGEDEGRYIVNTNRGVAYWRNEKDRRILYTVGANLYAIDADNGKLISSFGNNGTVDLRKGLLPDEEYDIEALSVNATSPGIIYNNTFILGSAVFETGNSAPGHIRAYDVLTGEMKWIFHTIPRPGEIGYDTWPKDAYKEIGGANSWSGFSLDEKRGVVYLGTGSPSFDFYGGNRKGKNLFGNSVLALDAETGGLKWYYQTIHHDLWDRDLPSPPNLTTIEHNGEMVDVAVQATKDGLIYVLNRDTGESIFPVEERPVPTDGLPGEYPYPTQKYPTKPLPLSHQVFTEDIITDRTPEAHAFVKDIYDQFRTDHKFTPPSVEGTLAFGYSGGAEWGGNAIDPDGILYQNSNNDPWVLQLIDTTTQNKAFNSLSKGNGLYLKNCAACHGQNREGSGTDFPSLKNVSDKLSKEEIVQIIKFGSGRMPAFQQISENDRESIVGYLFDLHAFGRPPVAHSGEIIQGSEVKSESEPVQKKKFGFKQRYVSKVWRKLADQDGYPEIKPPWGTLNAIDLKTGDYLWRVPLGEYTELTKQGIPITGTKNYGGPVVTAGGLIFIAATADERIRAFDKKTGKVVWEYQLPAGGFATPITYKVDGKQYVVIAAGGARGQKPGGNYVAFALKDK